MLRIAALPMLAQIVAQVGLGKIRSALATELRSFMWRSRKGTGCRLSSYDGSGGRAARRTAKLLRSNSRRGHFGHNSGRGHLRCNARCGQLGSHLGGGYVRAERREVQVQRAPLVPLVGCQAEPSPSLLQSRQREQTISRCERSIST